MNLRKQGYSWIKLTWTCVLGLFLAHSANARVANRIEADLRVAVGGNFHEAHLGPEAYAVMVERIKKNGPEYLAAWEKRYLRPKVDRRMLADEYGENILRLLKPGNPELVRKEARKLLEKCASFLAEMPEHPKDEEEPRIRTRLLRKQEILKELAG